MRIVVFSPSLHFRWVCGDEGDKASWIKRVVGLPGETVNERGESLYVNGHAVAQPYLPRGPRQDHWGPYRVPAAPTSCSETTASRPATAARPVPWPARRSTDSSG